MEITILGAIGLAHDGVAVRFPSVKVRGIFAVLLLSANQVVPVDKVLQALWDESLPPKGGKTLHSYVSRLRAILKEEGCGNLLTTTMGYQLMVDTALVDYYRFRKLADSGHAALAKGDVTAASEYLSAAIDLWRGRPIADLKTVWAERMRETVVARELLPAFHAWCEVKLAEGDGQFVLDQLRQMATSYPERENERAVFLHMNALAAVGRTSEITSVYADFARKLQQDGGVPPGDQLRALHQQLTATSRGRPRAGRRPSRSAAPSLQLLRDNPYYTGRDELLSQLDGLIDTAGRRNVIVSIDGAPGVGKTAFVTRWAWRRVDWFPDGMLYVDLDGYSVNDPVTPRDALSTFIRALGIAEIPPTEREQVGVLRHALADQKMLVILDNARNSDHVRPILGAVSCCAVIITSRQGLRHLAYEGLHGIMLPELDDEHAVALLTRKLGKRADPAVIHHLAELCGHLPLALRIVGEHIASRPAVPIRTLADELTHTRRRLLDVGGHGDGENALTLRAAFSWSINALPARSARLFRFLGLHPGPRFSVELAVAMSGDTRDATDTSLDLLIGAHLLQQDQTQRYFLHDVMHRYAADSAEEHESTGDREAAVGGMLDYYVETARHANSVLAPGPVPVPSLPAPRNIDPSTFDSYDAALRWMAAERPNLVAVARFASAHKHFHHTWRLVACLDVIFSRYGDRRERAQANQLGYKAAAAAGDRLGEAGLLNNVGGASLQLHDYDIAQRCYEEAHRIFVDEGDDNGLVVALHNLGRVHLARGEFRQAIRYFDRSLHTLAPGTLEVMEAHNWRRLGHAFRELGRFPEALTHYHRAHTMAAKIGAPRGPALIALAKLHLDQGRVAEAIKYCEQSLELHRKNLDRNREAESMNVLATAYLQGAAHRAVPVAQQAAVQYREMHELRGEAQALITLGRAYLALGERAHADERLRAAHELLVSVGDHEGVGEVGRILAAIAGSAVEIPGQRQLTIMEPSVRPDEVDQGSEEQTPEWNRRLP